jgi:hypothetical protein
LSTSLESLKTKKIELMLIELNGKEVVVNFNDDRENLHDSPNDSPQIVDEVSSV